MVVMLNNFWFEVEVAEMANLFLNELFVVELALKRELRGRRCENCGRTIFHFPEVEIFLAHDEPPLPHACGETEETILSPLYRRHEAGKKKERRLPLKEWNTAKEWEGEILSNRNRNRDFSGAGATKIPLFSFAVSLRIWMKRLVAQLVVPIIRHSIHDSRRCRELRCAEKTGHVLSVLREDAAPESS